MSSDTIPEVPLEGARVRERVPTNAPEERARTAARLGLIGHTGAVADELSDWAKGTSEAMRRSRQLRQFWLPLAAFLVILWISATATVAIWSFVAYLIM